MKLALIAGNRNLPLLFAQAAQKADQSLEIITIAFKGETSRKIQKFSQRTYWVEVGRLGEVIDILKKEGINKAVMTGQISPYHLFASRRRWDTAMQKVYQEVDDFRPHTIFSKIIAEIEKQGVEFISSASYLQPYLASEGVFGNSDIAASVRKDLTIGFELGKQIVDFDIGQTIVVKNRAIVAVEALEGTDNTIKRAFKLAGGGFCLIKLARRGHDVRFDLPVIGERTIKILGRCRAKAVLLEKDKVIIINKPLVFKLAEKYNLAILGISRQKSLKDLLSSA